MAMRSCYMTHNCYIPNGSCKGLLKLNLTPAEMFIEKKKKKLGAFANFVSVVHATIIQ